MAHAPTVLIMGPPGAGKGTQAGHLVATYGLLHVATGDLLREAVAAGTLLGLEAKSFIDKGTLVPDDLIIGMIREVAAELPEGSGLLLDGFPRTRAQAIALDKMLGVLDRDVDVVLDIRVPHEVLIKRLSGRWICRTCQTPYNVDSRPPKVAGVCDLDGGELYQRSDDTAEAVGTRLEVYETQTAPVSGYYRDHGSLVTIDGDQPSDEVRAALDAAMQPVTAG
ncbi:MAG: adenylate kinase [Thermoleophilia bacterium]|nr:adenylate kinase [Thermoleophilia bacterium]